MDDTRVDVIDGCDGLTPDMLRGPNRETLKEFFDAHESFLLTYTNYVWGRRRTKAFYSDPMHD